MPAADMNDAGMGVKFVRACCDKIVDLSEYRDNACPHFLFYMVRGRTTPVSGAVSTAATCS